ncbi:MAG: hypothetical protein ABIO46_05315 [Chitinophagales bacterium]
MKTLAILSALVLILAAGSLSAQDISNGDQKNKTNQCEVQSHNGADASTLDKLQKETEDISVMKPILLIVTIIEDRLQLHRLEKESVAAAKSRESGSR